MRSTTTGRAAIMGAVALAGLLGLAACGDNKAAQTPTGEAEGATSSAPTSVPGSAQAALEAPRPGLWRVTTSMEGLPGNLAIPPQEICVTEAKLEAPTGPAEAGADCTTQPFARQGDAMVTTSTCTLPGNVKADTAIRISGDFNSRYTTVVTTRLDPPPMPQMAETKMTLNAERLGDCPAN